MLDHGARPHSCHRVTVHSEDDERRCYLLDVVESIRFLELISMIEARIGGALGNRKLFGITQAGEVFELMNGETFSLHKTCAVVLTAVGHSRGLGAWSASGGAVRTHGPFPLRDL